MGRGHGRLADGRVRIRLERVERRLPRRRARLLARRRRRDPPHGPRPERRGALASCLAGSSGTFAADRGPLASVSFVTAHDGFTLADLTSYDRKHNSGNGESNRDGTDANRSWNHGVEGPTRDAAILAARRRTSRNLLGTLLVSAGIPMVTMGDDRGRTQRGNNNGYCLDNAATWMRWDEDAWRMDLHATTRHLLRIRRENPALRPVRYAEPDAHVPSASVLAWRDADGAPMTEAAWESTGTRTLQWITTSTPRRRTRTRCSSWSTARSPARRSRCRSTTGGALAPCGRASGSGPRS